MSSEPSVEARLTAVERELSELKKRLPANGDQDPSWVEKIAGTFEGDADFDEIVRLGREFRKSVDEQDE
jgi:hypothetical protein